MKCRVLLIHQWPLSSCFFCLSLSPLLFSLCLSLFFSCFGLKRASRRCLKASKYLAVPLYTHPLLKRSNGLSWSGCLRTNNSKFSIVWCWPDSAVTTNVRVVSVYHQPIQGLYQLVLSRCGQDTPLWWAKPCPIDGIPLWQFGAEGTVLFCLSWKHVSIELQNCDGRCPITSITDICKVLYEINNKYFWLSCKY